MDDCPFCGYSDATAAECQAKSSLLDEAKNDSAESLDPNGFDFGINCGKAGGQAVIRLHVHLIPRNKGGADDPRGGMRGAIPVRQKY